MSIIIIMINSVSGDERGGSIEWGAMQYIWSVKHDAKETLTISDGAEDMHYIVYEI